MDNESEFDAGKAVQDWCNVVLDAWGIIFGPFFRITGLDAESEEIAWSSPRSKSTPSRKPLGN